MNNHSSNQEAKTMSQWTIGFLGSSQKVFVKAMSRKQAIEIFCKQEGIKPSGYLICRKSTRQEVA